MALLLGRMPWGVVLLVVALAGCSRQAEIAYTLRADTEKLEIPQKHQDQISDYLDYLYGTPSDPRLSIPRPADEAATDDATSSEPTTEDAAKPGPMSILKMDKPGYDRQTLKLGHAVYVQQCVGCHGTSGDGLGAAAKYLNPPPRDYRKGTFKFTSTPLGSKPRLEDLKRIIIYGAKGTSMPSFRWLPEDELDAVIKYVQVLSYRGELELALLTTAEDELDEADDFEPAAVAAMAQDISDKWDRAESEKVLAVTVNPPRTEESIQAGALAFAEMNCVKCHNRDARGSKTADVGQDTWGRTAFPADLTMGTLHGGRRPIDIYRRIYSGINGTPMPSSKEPDSTKNETAEERSNRIWNLVHFVTNVIENNEIPAPSQAIIDETMTRIKNEINQPPPAPDSE